MSDSSIERMIEESGGYSGDAPHTAAWNRVSAHAQQYYNGSLLLENLGGGWSMRQDQALALFKCIRRAPLLFAPEAVEAVIDAGNKAYQWTMYWNQQRLV